MKIIILILIVFLTGCNRDIAGWEINKSLEYCKDVGISVYKPTYMITPLHNTVICNDGKIMLIRKKKT